MGLWWIVGGRLGVESTAHSIHPPTYAGLYFRKMERGMYVYDRPFLLAIENPLDTSADVGRCVAFHSFACVCIVCLISTPIHPPS